jgi:hypothetical protein
MSTSHTSTTGDVHNPRITSADVIEFRKANLAMSGTASTRYKDDAKVGTSIRWGNISAPNSGAARAKVEGNDQPITYDVTTETATLLTINQHNYSSFEIEEFEDSLSIVDLEKWAVRGAAYVVDLAVDDLLAGLPDGFTQNVGTLGVDLTDDDIRRSDQYLEDADAPSSPRFFVMSPATKNSMLGIDRYVSSDFGAAGSIIKGEFGTIYGAKTIVSTNVEGTNAAGHDNSFHHQDAFALGMRMSPKTRRHDDIDNLSQQISISVIFGAVETRDDHGVWLKGA